MATFFRLIFEDEKEKSLKNVIAKIREGIYNPSIYSVDPNLFYGVPSAPFSYWVSDEVRNKFNEFDSLTNELSKLTATKGLATTDDFRFIRTKWEVKSNNWLPLAKGGDFSPYYADLKLRINWGGNGKELKAYLDHKIGKPNQWSRWINAVDYYKKPGLTWPNATTSDLSARVLPSECIISHMAPTLFIENDSWEDLSPFLAILNSKVFKFLVSMSLGLAAEARKHYEVGVIQKIPVPKLSQRDKAVLSELALKAFENLKFLDFTDETSEQFILPELLLKEQVAFDRNQVIQAVKSLQFEIDNYCFELFGINELDRVAINQNKSTQLKSNIRTTKQEQQDTLSWFVGVSFGRFENQIEMLPLNKQCNPFVSEILSNVNLGKVESLLTEYELCEKVEQLIVDYKVCINTDVSKFLKKEFFALHVKKYTDSRRQAPIYWQLSSYNCSFSYWFYFDELNSQSLIMCVNDKIEPVCEELESEILKLNKSEKNQTAVNIEQEKLLSLRDELESLKLELLNISKTWVPNLHDGVQIIAAPFWRLFQHKAWQKKLKQTWEKLQGGEYDWAHLAFSTWPERVLKKCHEDRSLAIAHDVEDDLWHEVEVIKGRNKEPVWEWQPKPLTDAELHAYIRQKIATDGRLKLYRSNQSANANGGAL